MIRGQHFKADWHLEAFNQSIVTQLEDSYELNNK